MPGCFGDAAFVDYVSMSGCIGKIVHREPDVGGHLTDMAIAVRTHQSSQVCQHQFVLDHVWSNPELVSN